MPLPPRADPPASPPLTPAPSPSPEQEPGALPNDPARRASAVFISYAHQDRARAEVLCGALEAAGLACWIAPRDIMPGAEWGAAIVEAIAEARAMVLVLSTHANDSRQVLREVERAVHHGVPVVPVRVDGVEPAHGMAYYLSTAQWLEAGAGPTEAYAPRVVEAVRRLLERGGLTNSPRPPRPWLGRRYTRIAAVAAMIAAAVAAGSFGWRAYEAWRAGNAPVDTTRLLVLPPELAPGTRGVVDARLTERLYDAFARWRGLSLVDAIRVSEALARDSSAMRSNAAVAALARSLRAGRYVRTRVTPLGDSVAVYSVLYEVGREQPLFQATRRLTIADSGTVGDLAPLADALLLREAGVDAGTVGTTVLAAAQDLVRARKALGEWDLTAADAALTSALSRDGTAASTTFWLAQVKAWQGVAPARWQELAERGTSDTTHLTPEERPLALALAALGRGDYDAACRRYAEIRSARPRYFGGWYGLAQCYDLDRTVVRDDRSPSGWRFRSSYARALTAYEQALVLTPGAHVVFERGAFDLIRRKLVTSMTSTRLGIALTEEGDTARFLARPALLADTIAFTPYPMRLVLAGAPATVPPTLDRAVNRGRAAFQRVATAWAAALPNSAGVWEAVAVSRDLLGDPSAADALVASRRLATDSSKRTQLAVDEALIRIKYSLPDRLEGLRLGVSLRDSLLAAGRIDSARSALLSPLAALTGDCGRAIGLARRGADASGPSPSLSRQLYEDVQALLVQSALGCSGMPHRLTVDDVVSQLPEGSRASSGDSPVTPYLVAGRAVSLMQPLDSAWVTRLAESSDDYLLRAERAAVMRDTAGVRNVLAGVVSARRTLRSNVVSLDAALPEARLWLSVRDTASAVATLDAALRGVRSAAPGALGDVAIAASMGRAIQLRADLAERRGDAVETKRWRAALAILWGRPST